MLYQKFVKVLEAGGERVHSFFSFLGAWTVALYALHILRIVLTMGSCDQLCCCSLVIRLPTVGKNWVGGRRGRSNVVGGRA